METITVKVGRKQMELVLMHVVDMTLYPVLSELMERKGYHAWVGYAKRPGGKVLTEVYRKAKTNEYVAQTKAQKFY